MKEWVISYIRHGQPIPEGFERHDGLDDTHHGHYACFAVQALCQCGQPLKTEDRSHGIFTLCCGRQLESCCGE
jgi:hypothetical protein